jgi:threonine dehydrogenase-like Zn-dependent dehydrogenase
MKTMQALMWTGPSAMEMQTVSEPELGTDGVIVDVQAVGICGSELGGYLGHNSLRVPPLIMGHEAAGIVAAVSADVRFADGTPATVGARVTFNPLITCGACEYCLASRENLCPKRRLIGAHVPGAFAQRVGVPARLCYPVPGRVSFTTASLAEPLACALRAVETAALSPGQTLAILGAGPIGLFCLRAAVEAGIERVLISDIDERRLALARAWGATAIVNSRTDDLVPSAKVFAPFGPHAVIDAVGSDATRAQAISAVKPGGRVVLIGLHAEASSFAANYAIRQEITVAGTFGYVAKNYAAAVDMLICDKIAVSNDWVAQRPLADGRASFDELISGKSQYAKIVLIPSG